MRDERRVKKDKREEALFTRKRYFVDRVETEQIFVLDSQHLSVIL